VLMPVGLLRWLAIAAFLSIVPVGGASADKVMRVGMTASDLPTTGGIPNNGGEGFRFLGFPAFDALVNWDFKHTDQTADVTPGLATSWEIDEVDHTRWTFHLRHGVKFHDGTDFNADAVIFTLGRIYDDKSPQFDATSSPIVRAVVSMVQRWEKIDDYTVAIYTKVPFSHFPYLVTRILYVSPTAWEKAGRNWVEFAKAQAGTGPFKIVKVTPRVSVEMARNPDYWDPDRIPKLDRMVVMPMPEANTRVSALRAGQVDWIEVPPPDAVPSLKAAGFEIVTNSYPHVWPWVLNFAKSEGPFSDVRVRRALNYCTNREGLVTLLNGLAEPAAGVYHKTDPYFGHPKEQYAYDPAKAQALLKEAGYGPDKPVAAKVMISTSGSGQMLPLAMNEYLQQNLKECNFDISFEVVDWGTMLVAMRNPPTAPQSRGIDAVNISLAHGTEFSRFTTFFLSSTFPPNGFNWANWKNPEFDTLVDQIEKSSDPEEIAGDIRRAHEVIVDDAAWLFIVHDLNPRAMTKHVKGFVSAQSWFQDFTRVYME